MCLFVCGVMQLLLTQNASLAGQSWTAGVCVNACGYDLEASLTVAESYAGWCYRAGFECLSGLGFSVTDGAS